MYRERKPLRVVGAPFKTPFHQKVIDPFKNVVRSCFPRADTGPDLTTALVMGAQVASHVKSQREVQRGAELERYYDLCDTELPEVSGEAGDLEEVPTPEARAGEGEPESHDRLSVLPVTKSIDELTGIFDGLGSLLSDSQAQLKSAEAQLRNAEVKAQAHIDGVSLQLRTSIRKIERLEGVVRDLNAEKVSLASRAEVAEKAVAVANEKCTTLSAELETATKELRRLEEAGRNSFLVAMVTTTLIGAALLGALYFMGIIH